MLGFSPFTIGPKIPEIQAGIREFRVTPSLIGCSVLAYKANCNPGMELVRGSFLLILVQLLRTLPFACLQMITFCTKIFILSHILRWRVQPSNHH